MSALLPPVLSDRMMDEEISLSREPGTSLVRGLAAILAMQPVLVELAERCGQRGAMDYLRYFLTGPYIGAKMPVLVLVYGSGRRLDGADGGAIPGGDTGEDLVGAVIVQEYQVLGARSGIFMTDDESGERTVIARPAARAWVTAAAAAGLLARGAKLILLAVQMRGAEMERVAGWGQAMGARCVWGGAARGMDQYLPVLETSDATLGTLGKHTRRNLRYYRRRSEEKLGSVFVPRVEMWRAEFLEVNRVCSYPVPDAIAGWRYDSTMEVAGRLFAGVRAGDGRWLSLVGGRHHHDMTAIAWQMNREEMASDSLSTVMRSYLLQYEVERGTKRLSFDGGTPHSIHHAFVQAEVAYVVAARRSVTGELLRRGVGGVLPKGNFLRRVLSDDGMRWYVA